MQTVGNFSQFNAEQAVKETEMENLILELNNDVDNICFVLRDIEMIMYETDEYFKGQVANALRDKFEFYKRQIEVVKNNLLTYPNDLIAIKNSMQNNDKNINVAYAQFSDEIIAEANKK